MNTISNITGKYEQAYLSEAAEKQGVTPQANAPAETMETERSQDDRVSLSDESREMQAAKDAVAASPDIRQDRVNEIKMAIESGDYQMDPAKIAEKMMSAMVDIMA